MINTKEIHQVLLDIDTIVERADMNDRTRSKIKEFVELMIAHAMTDKKITIKVLGFRKIITISEGKLSYHQELKEPKVHITKKIKEKLL